MIGRLISVAVDSVRGYSIDSSVKTYNKGKLYAMLNSERAKDLADEFGTKLRFSMQGDGLIVKISRRWPFRPAEPRHYQVDGSGDICAFEDSVRRSKNAYHIRLHRRPKTTSNQPGQRTALMA